jgi:hypothetical protein
MNPSAAGLPDLPVNALAIDPQSGSGNASSRDIYAGTDIAVYRSTNGGQSWTVYGSGLPRVATFGLEIQSPNRLIRSATHGRGMYDTTIAASAPAAPQLLTATSRKTHGSSGTFDINMPLTGTSGVECRRGSTTGNAPGDFTIVLRFSNVLSGGMSGGSATFASTSGGTGSVNSVVFSGSDMIVALTNVSNAQTATLTVNNVQDANGNTLASASVPLGFNIGDVAATDRTTNAGDVTVAKNASGAALSVANFRSDVNTDGAINSGDALTIKSKSGSTIP